MMSAGYDVGRWLWGVPGRGFRRDRNDGSVVTSGIGSAVKGDDLPGRGLLAHSMRVRCEAKQLKQRSR